MNLFLFKRINPARSGVLVIQISLLILHFHLNLSSMAQSNTLELEYSLATELYHSRDYSQALGEFLRIANHAEGELKAKCFNGAGLSYLNKGNYDSASIYLEKSFQLRKILQDSSGMANNRLNLGNVYLRRSWYQLAAMHYQHTLNDYETIISDRQKASLYNNLSLALMHQAKYEESYEVLLEAIALARETDNYSTLANCWMNVGNVYEKLGKEELAIAAYDSAKQGYRFINDSISLMQVKYNQVKLLSSSAVDIERVLSQYDSIEAFFIRKKVEPSLFKLYNARADLLRKVNRMDESLQYRYRAIDLPNNIEDESIRAKVNLAESLLRMDREHEAGQILFDLSSFIGKSTNLDLMELYYECNMRYYDDIQEKDSAYAYAHRYYKARIQLEKQKAQERLQESLSANELLMKKQELEQLSTEHRLLQEEKKRQQQLTFLVGTVGILGFLLILYRRKNLKQKLLITEQKQAITRGEIKALTLEKKQLRTELEVKKREALTESIRIADRNQLIQTISQELNQLKSAGDLNAHQEKKINSLLTEVRHLPFEKAMEAFSLQFNEVNPSFRNLFFQQNPKLTEHDFLLASGIVVGMNSQQLTALFQISFESLRKARYRLKKKLGLTKEDDLVTYLVQLNQSEISA